MAYELYITTSNMLGKDLLTEFLEDESKRARKLVYYHGAEDTLTYDQHMLLAGAGKRMAIQFEETEPGELLFALGTLLGAKPAGPVFVISDEALLPEGIMERYGIKMYTGNPKTAKKSAEKKTERKPRTKLTSKKQAESVKKEPHGSEEPDVSEGKSVETVEPETVKETVDAEVTENAAAETEETDAVVEEPSEGSDEAQEDFPEDNDTEPNVDTESNIEESADADADEESEDISEEIEDEDVAEETPEVEAQTDEKMTADVSNESSDDAEIPDILDKNKHTIFEKYFAGVDIEKLEKIDDMDQLIREVAYIIYQERYFGADVVEKLKERIGNGWELVNDRVEQKHQIMKAFIPARK